jgi:hypothetical protein
MESHYDTDAFHTMTVIFQSIVLEIEPAPIMVEDPTYQSYLARNRRSVLESPPPTHADITPSKYVRYNPNYDPDANSPVPDSTASASSSDANTPVPSYASGTTPSHVTFSPHDHHAKYVVQTENMLRISTKPIRVFDSGCSISGTSDFNDLSDVTDCGPMTLQGAFGPPSQPTKCGLLTSLQLDAILIPGMGNETFISLSQFCAGGISGRQNVGVFTKDGCRFFTMDSSLPALKVFADTGYEVARGTVQGGIYVQESA